MRQCDIAWEVRDYLKTHPCAAVVNRGCGLDNTGRACDNGRCKIYNLDFPDVIALRQQLLPAAQIDHRRTGVGFQIIPHLPRKVALPHGHLQRTEALHQAAGCLWIRIISL